MRQKQRQGQNGRLPLCVQAVLARRHSPLSVSETSCIHWRSPLMFVSAAAVMYTSGTVTSQAERRRSQDLADAKAAAEAQRLADLRADESRPLVFLDVEIQGKAVGRMEFVLFTEESPLAAENFRALCTGEKGIQPAGGRGAGLPMHFKVRCCCCCLWSSVHGYCRLITCRWLP